MKIKIYEVLTEEEQNTIYEIIKKIKLRVKNGELSKYEAYEETKKGSEVRAWMDSIQRKEEFYNMLIPPLQKEALNGYEKIFKPLIDKGVVVASNAGTQLGIIRDSSLIKWDDDIDLIIDIKDFNKFKWEIFFRGFTKGWIPRIQNWIKNDYSNYRKSGIHKIQFFSLKRLKLDFGKFTTSYFPFIDLFPGIKVSENQDQRKREEVALSLVRYYDKFYMNQSDDLIRNKRIEKYSPFYHESLIEYRKSNQDLEAFQIISELQKNIELNYDENGVTFMQLHIATPTFSNFTYLNRNVKKINAFNKEYSFIISDNYEEQFVKEYGDDWRKPRMTKVHIFLIWFIKFKKTKELK